MATDPRPTGLTPRSSATPRTGPWARNVSKSLLRPTTAGFSEIVHYGGHNQTIHYDDVLGSNFLVEASLSRALNRIQETPSVNDPAGDRSHGRAERPSPQEGSGFYEAGNRSNSWQYEAKATNIVNGFGEHSIRYGVDYEKLDLSQINQRTGPTFTTPDGQQTATGAQIQILSDPNFGKIYRVSSREPELRAEHRSEVHAFFVQDTWKIGNR